MTGADWIIEKLNSIEDVDGIKASIESENVVFVQRSGKPNAYVGIIPTNRKISAPLVNLPEVQVLRSQKPDMALMIAIPRETRWSGMAMEWLRGEEIAFGGSVIS